MKIKINRYSFIAFFMFHGLFLKLYYVGNTSRLEQGLVLGVFLYLMLDFLRNQKKYRKYSGCNAAVFAFCLMVLYTGFINRYTTENRTFLASVIHVMMIVDVFIGFEYFERKGALEIILRTFLFWLVVYTVITDCVMFLFPELHHTYGELYFIGNKFVVIQFHTFLYACASTLKKDRLAKFVLLFTAFLSLYMHAITGFVSCIIIFVASANPLFIKNKIQTITASLSLLIGSSTVLLLFDGIMSLSNVNNILTFFNKTGTMNSRMRIYASIFPILESKPWWGYGYNNSFAVLFQVLRAPNTQNGLLEIVFQFGIIGLVLFFLVIVVVLKYSFKGNKNMGYPFFCLILVAFATSSVEITLGFNVLKYLAIYMVLSRCNYREKSQMASSSLRLDVFPEGVA